MCLLSVNTMNSESTRLESSSLLQHVLRHSSLLVHRKRPLTVESLLRGKYRRKIKTASQGLSGIICALYGILLLNTFSLVVLASSRSADYGGNRGWALGLSGTDDYASVGGYFSDDASWPTHEVTGMIQNSCESYSYFH